MMHNQRGAFTSLLELEAVEYFNLDLSQTNLGFPSRLLANDGNNSAKYHSNSSLESLNIAKSTAATTKTMARKSSSRRTRAQNAQFNSNRGSGGANGTSSSQERPQSRVTRVRDCRRSETSFKTANLVPIKQMASSQRVRNTNRATERGDGHSTGRNETISGRFCRKSPQFVAGSSTTSTNSLPSITSSPSVSPSLVCPHLSLDDLLACRQGSSGSPHTIGLCQKCRLDPPPNIQSPLSPQFRPHSRCRHSSCLSTSSKRVVRGYSDHSASYCSVKQARNQEQQQQQAAMAQTQSQSMLSRHQSDLSRIRDDSLDFCLEPAELRRMQMSPTMRNSVEFIRRNSIESGRVVKIFKNGQPFERPLRVCILRGEFSTLTHLLDHINTRLLVPLGARYLFHLDGQLVYSVHELKHNSVYVVSGTRAFDYRTSEVLKEQQRREKLNKMNIIEQKHALNKLNQPLESSLKTTQQRATGSECKGASGGSKLKQEANHNVGNLKSSPASVVQSCEQQAEIRPAESHSLARMKQAPSSRMNKPLSFRPIEPRQTKAEANKFSRYDDSTQLASSGGATASDQSISLLDDNKKPPVKMARAKSELSALPLKKQKKNVTFMDTGRGSSPATSDLSSSETATSNGMLRRTVSTATEQTERVELNEQSELKRELATSEVGIQVSDSIDGFLIDLPVALPAKGDDSNLADKPRPRLGQKPKGNSAKTETGASQQQATGSGAANKKAAQIVTITERQLSHEEMNELTDLSQGDHHEIIIKWGPPDDQQQHETTLPVNREDNDPNEPDLVPDRSNTIAIGKDPQEQQNGSESAVKSLVTSGRLITSGANEELEKGVSVTSEQMSVHWQYPGGEAASKTPTERPVSQSGPSESVRARVTTPTPSLSTGGDNNSLTLSYDTISTTSALENSHEPVRKQRRPTSTSRKSREEVRGVLCDGLDAPSRSFRLLWVNGFAINDLYPENSVDVQRLAEAAGDRAGQNERPTPISASGASLSPSVQRTGQFSAGNEHQQSEFKPSERYHNWICHSRKHDELVYPAGALIVLWCRWNNEQRFYGRHTSDVTCLTLATLDLDLAASAQVGDSLDKRQTGSSVHIWKLSNLMLLQVIEDDQFKTKLIFSLRLKNTKTSGCELSIAARDDKQLFLCEYSGKLVVESGQVMESGHSKSKSTPGSERRNSKGANGNAVQQQQNCVLLRASKVLQSNQLPLFVLRVPKLVGVNQTDESNNAIRQQQVGEPLISFGRRHFGVWAPDVRQKKLRPMQADGKSAKVSELMAKANCLCRISPDEFLLGDSDGNITLLMLNCAANQTPAASGAVKRKLSLAKSSLKSKSDPADSRYSIKTVTLLGPGPSCERLPNLTRGRSISCLSRISGSLFMSADSSCTIRFWKIKRVQETSGQEISCEQLQSISLPPDLGFICTLLLAQYNLKESLVEFYVVSTNNSILIGSVKLARQTSAQNGASQSKGNERVDLLSSCSLSVVYEGHETHVSGLVSDSSAIGRTGANCEPSGRLYFTCSLDCRICKWDGPKLIWKSMLPSACVTLAVHLTGNVLAVGSIDGTVYILDKTSGLLISYFPLTPVRINCLAYSSDGSLLAAGCANGSIFMLPVDDQGLKYRKVSIFQSPSAVVSLQFSLDNRYMLTSVSHGAYQELILWDLPNFRYMRDDVKLAADKIHWFDSICSGSEDVRAIWENAHLADQLETGARNSNGTPKRSFISSTRNKQQISNQFVVNLSCHRLIRPGSESFVIASDTRGHLRLFRYPAYDIQQGFYAARVGSSPVNCCRFLESTRGRSDYFVTTSLDGSICLWALE